MSDNDILNPVSYTTFNVGIYKNLTYKFWNLILYDHMLCSSLFPFFLQVSTSLWSNFSSCDFDIFFTVCNALCLDVFDRLELFAKLIERCYAKL